MAGRSLSRPSRFALRSIRAYQMRVRHRIGARCRYDVSCSEFALQMYRRHGFLRASARTALRLARCRPSGVRLPRRMVAAFGLILVAFAFWGGPAVAQVEGPCTITVATQGQASNVNSHSTPGTALPVRYGQILRIDTVSTGAITGHLIELELAGISWTADQGLDSGNTWGGEINVSSYAGGYGLHKVTGTSLGPGACSGTAYVLVEGGNPLSGPVGGGAAAATGVGVVALAATTVRAGKEGSGAVDAINASYGPHEPAADWIEGIAGAASRPHGGIAQPALQPAPSRHVMPTEDILAAVDDLNRGLPLCALALPRAILLTMATMAVGAGAPAAPYSLRRVRWRLRASLVGLAGGFLTALGTLVLLQQYGVVYPTLTVTIVGLLAGILVSILIPSLVRLANVRRINRAIGAAEVRLSETEQASQAEWQATHTVPAEGMAATEAPDPSSEVIATLGAGLSVQVVTVAGDWAQVVAENGWWGWVDARALETLTARRKPRSTGRAKAAITPKAEKSAPPSDEAVPADWYPDPSGEARLRYWDGTEWTSDTAG